MNVRAKHEFQLPPEQQAIRDKCFHPSGTFVEFPIEDVETSIPARFEKIVRMYPERLAVKVADRAITYKELNQVANRIAQAIIEKYGSDSEPMILFADHGVSSIISCLGILKAGKIVVALDSLSPQDRLTEMFEDSHAAAILTETNYFPRALALAKNTDAVINIDEIDIRISTENLGLNILPDAPAQLRYTSGSTGRPKGVLRNHRRNLHSCMLTINAAHIGCEDRLLLLRDSILKDIFNGLLSGAVIVPFYIRKKGFDGLADLLNEEKITYYTSTPSTFRYFMNEVGAKQTFPSVRLIQLGGEPLTIREVDAFKKHFTDKCILMNQLSSNETGTICQYLLMTDTDICTPIIPVGYPVEGKEVSLLDGNGQEVETGEVGEIAVKSLYLSSGYWRSPELITSKFYGADDDTSSRLHLTGDLARWLPNGRLLYLGRKDDQIKIRGFKVELSEIEALLFEHPKVKDATVVTCDRDNGDKYLAAYIVSPADGTPKVDELRGFLAKKLPDYMIPSVFVRLDAMPLTPNGKVDRKALPEPEKNRPELSVSYVTPRTTVEEKVAQIWTEILSLDQVGIHDNFFELGGHSLLAMRILSAVNGAFAVEVSMRSLLDAPTVAGLAEQIELSQTLEEQIDPTVSTRHGPIMSASGRDAKLPLSYAEEGLWLIEQLQPGMSTWNMQSRLRLRGSLNVEALTRSLNALIQRHETFRTAYQLVDGNPIRVTTPVLTVEIPTTQLEPSLDMDAEINRISIEDEKHPFDLAEVPLFRVRLVRIDERDHVLVFTRHHIITDAWSSHVFTRELFTLYDVYSIGHPSPLAELPIQYSDYALWVRQSGQEDMANQLAYWRGKLKENVVQEIPADKHRPFERSYRGAKERIQLSKEHSRALRELCREERATLFMLLVAAFKILLSRYTGSSDIVIGSVLAGRSRPELENLIGMFINILPLRTDLSGQPTFRELLQRVRETCLEAYQHQDMPFEKLVEELNPGRGLSRNPFFQVLFDVANLPPIKHEVSDLEIEALSRFEDTARYEVVIRAPETSEGVAIWVDYNVDLFSRSRIAEMMEQYKYLLEQITTNPDRRIADYSLLTFASNNILPDPKAPLDDTWHGAVHELMARQAKRQPDKIAVKDWQEAWTYRELDQRSNQLAQHLLAQGIGREDVVALYGPTSGSLVWGLMGTLKAGAAFFILDPAHPAQRLKDCLDLLQPKALIQFGSVPKPHPGFEDILTAATLKCRVTLPHLVVAKATEFQAEYLQDDPKMPVSADDLAYVIFTSGTTGTPKGVMGRHGPLTHFLPWVQEAFQVSASDRFSALAGLSSNILQREIFTSLSVGGTLHIPNPDHIGNLGKLDAWMKNEAVSVVHLTPGMARLMFDSANQSIQSIRRVFFAGDLLKLGDVDKARKLMPNAEVINFYNSSESQRAGGYIVIPGERNGSKKETVPLGHGIKDVQLLVLNQNGELAGVGEQGEICVRSPHLARGYLGDEALTNVRFIINPFTGIKGDRIYRTGELGRYLPDGNVEFVARSENRFSIRGFRIELSEIESVLSDHPAIEQAVVVGETPSERLVAYLRVRKGQVVKKHELRGFLRTRLPRYMVPALFVPMDSIPLTATGKVNRDALPQPNDKDTQSDKAYVAPRNETESSLCRVWSEVLGVYRVGIDDDFFDLGGHSLLAARLFRRLDEQFGRSFPLGILFSASTVRTLAENYRTFNPREKSPMLVALCGNGTLPPLYAVPGLFGNVVGFADLSRELGSDQPFYGLQSAGLDGIEAPLDSIEEMAARYIREVRTIQPHGPYALIGACFGGTVAYDMARQLLNVGEEVAFLGLLDPTRRERNGAHKNPAFKLRTLKRITALNSLFTDRLRLYHEEMRGLLASDRIKYVTRKLLSLVGKIGNNNRFTATVRELHQIEVYHANISAHRAYRRKPLHGRLRAFEIFESNHPRNNRGILDLVDWDGLQVGQTKRLRAPGKDSGDMLSGENARVLGALLRERLRAAFSLESAGEAIQSEQRAEIDCLKGCPR